MGRVAPTEKPAYSLHSTACPAGQLAIGEFVAPETYTSSTVTQPRRGGTGAPAVPAPGAPDGDPGTGSWSLTGLTDSPARTPRSSTPAPRLRQLMGVCGWAAVLGGVGLVLGIRGLFGVLTHSAPGWFEPAMSLTGVVGIALTVGGFLTVHRRRAPWIFLGAGSVVLVVAMILTSKAF